MGELNPLEAARSEREKLLRGIENTGLHMKRLQDKLKAVDKTIEILKPVYGTKDERVDISEALDILEPPPGITDAVRAALQTLDHYVIPTALRDGLRQTGLLKDYENEMAVIHQVLRRLEKQAQIESTDTAQGKAYRWKSAASKVSKSAPARNSLAATIFAEPRPTSEAVRQFVEGSDFKKTVKK